MKFETETHTHADSISRVSIQLYVVDQSVLTNKKEGQRKQKRTERVQRKIIVHFTLASCFMPVVQALYRVHCTVYKYEAFSVYTLFETHTPTYTHRVM